MRTPRASRTERLGTDAAGLDRAAAILGRGGLVAFPTETVYGLGADGRNGMAVAALYAAKGRPSFNPLIAHVSDSSAARRIGRLGPAAAALAEAFWPGPLTLVVPISSDCDVADLARAGLDTVAIRVPSHPVARELLDRTGFPIVAPSANRSGQVSPTEADHVLTDLDGRIDAIVEGGATAFGVESTIIACLAAGPTLLRPGGVTREAIQAVLGRPLGDLAADAAPLAPGCLASHYAPRAHVRLNADRFEPDEAVLLFGPPPDRAPASRDSARAMNHHSRHVGSGAQVATLNLSPSGDLVEAATNLFAYLRRLDASGATTIAVAPIPEHSLGEAINDRLRRAAAPR